ncbi:hypothetical protein BDK61_1479 [Haloarcula quadrata]|uniref:Uncharacterized protein n=1 Tax=Haloarcula quadrata TaxID=182779 RepID=A0A495R4M8_9EURY|nr:hypothetical protein [Haloarcula quadrata]RKS82179.1 hypothetical protein BDK61_1479 [Haloarcula quadrata]
MSDDEEEVESATVGWLATEKTTTNGRRVATALVAGALGTINGITSIPDRALDVPVDEHIVSGGKTIYTAVYYPIDPLTLYSIIAMIAAALVLWHVFDTDDAADEAGDDR